jgi:2Fe-2S ferredoxin
VNGVRRRATVTFVQADGVSRQVEAPFGASLMEAALRVALPGIEAKCRGSCACVTCHVYIDTAGRPPLDAPDAMEESMLDFADEADARSRLSCQILVTEACEGLVVHVPAEQRVLGL